MRFFRGPLDWASKPTNKEQSSSFIDDLAAWQDKRRRTVHIKGLGEVVLEPKKKQPNTLAELVQKGLEAGTVQKPQPGSLAETVQNRVLELLNPTGSRTKDVKPRWQYLWTSEGEVKYIEGEARHLETKAKGQERSILDIMLDQAEADDFPETTPLGALEATLRKLAQQHN